MSSEVQFILTKTKIFKEFWTTAKNTSAFVMLEPRIAGEKNPFHLCLLFFPFI